MNQRYQYLDTPIGRLRLVSGGSCLAAVEFEGHHGDPGSAIEAADAVLERTAGQLQQYFAGRRRQFDLPLAPVGTAFQRAVWKALRAIPWGALCSYADIARAIDRPTAVRAVGAANGRNPLPIIVPCHRVVGSDGSLTGFSGGIEVKRQLLVLEGSLGELPLTVP
jgi:methylated-DNA-[protein]-cysteine S-methyltransferase